MGAKHHAHADTASGCCINSDMAVAVSIHSGAIFPGTGQRHRPEANAYN